MGSVHFRSKPILVRVAEGREVQPGERSLPGSRGKRGGGRGRKRGRRRGAGGQDLSQGISLHSSYALSQAPLFSPFLPCPVCLSLLSIWVSLSVLAAYLCFTLTSHPGILGGLFVSSCCLFPPLLCLLLSLLMAVCLHVFLGWLGVCLSVHPLISGSWKHPLRSLMCGCEILFEYCSSQLLVAKGTGQEKWGNRGGHREPGGGCGHAFLFSSSLLRSFSKAERKDDNLK